MKVRVYAPSFCDHTRLDSKGFMEISEGATLNDVVKNLKIPFVFRKLLIVSVNYDKSKLSQRLNEGDVISILGSISSG